MTDDLPEELKQQLSYHQGGRKFDDGKLDWALMPFEALKPVLDVLEHGAAKYAKNNWKQLENAEERYQRALMRHCIDYMVKGFDALDKDSGLPEIAHIATNAIFLLHFYVERQNEQS